MRIEAVPPAEVRRWWGFVAPGVREVFAICHERTLPEDVYARLQSAQASLFLFFVGSEPKGFGVVEVCADAGGKYLNVWVMHFVGEVDANRQELEHWIDSLTRGFGCARAQFTSPRAWAKLLKGFFKEKAVIYEREVK